MSQGIIYTIYRQPRDFPQHFVVRRHLIHRGYTEPEPVGCLCDSLEEARSCVPRECVNIGRERLDEPQIVESWI